MIKKWNSFKINESSEELKSLIKDFKEKRKNSTDKVTAEEVSKLLDYDDIINGYDNEILNWIDYEQMEDEEYESEFDYYVDYGNGEAEDVVLSDYLSGLDLGYDDFEDGEYEELKEIIVDKTGISGFNN
jgi:hypothetical protein